MKMEYFDGGQWVSLSTEASSVPVDSRLDWVNGNHQGFRWGHYTDPGNPLGMFHLSQLSYVQDQENSGYTSSRLLTFNEQGNHAFMFHAPVTPFSMVSADLKSLLTLNNSNPAATAAGLMVQNNGADAVEFGFNNSTNEGYLWGLGTASLKFGTGGIKRMALLNNGTLDMLNNGMVNLNNIAGKITSVESAFQVYLRASSSTLALRGGNVRGSKASAIMETNALNETASIVLNGDYIQTIQTFDDLGFIFTDEDFDPATTYQSYISANGSLVISSSAQRKHSLRPKKHKDYLARLNHLNVYSYGLRVPLLSSDDDKRKSRKYYKNRHLHVGLLAEEVETLFDNATDGVKLLEIGKDNQKELKKLTRDYIPDEREADYVKRKNALRHSPGIRYDTLLCYMILAVQELSQKVEALEQQRNAP